MYRKSQSAIILGLVVFVLSAITEASARPPVKIVTLGDSITKGVRSGVSSSQTFSALLQDSLIEQEFAATVVNVGIGGERTDQALKRLEKSVISQKPTLVTIMYGTNDSYVDKGKKASRISKTEYERNLHQIITRLRKEGIIPVLMTSPRWGKNAGKNGLGEHPNLRLAKYVAACRQVARETKTPLIDHFSIWSNAVEKGTDLGDWTTDQCHPNPVGHELISRSMLPVILKTLKANRRIRP